MTHTLFLALATQLAAATNETCPIDYSRTCAVDSDCGASCTCIKSGWSGQRNFCAPVGSKWCRKSAPQYFCPVGYQCPDEIGRYGPCKPPGAMWCSAMEAAGKHYCEVGFKCVHSSFCMPPGATVCDGVTPPYCAFGEKCIEHRACAPPNATAW